MKKLLAFLMIMVLVISPALAATIYYPANVKEIRYAEYSSGGGDKAVVYVKVLCIMNDDSYKLFIDSAGSVSGFFGVGRFHLPSCIDFKVDSSLKNKIRFEK